MDSHLPRSNSKMKRRSSAFEPLIGFDDLHLFVFFHSSSSKKEIWEEPIPGRTLPLLPRYRSSEKTAEMEGIGENISQQLAHLLVSFWKAHHVKDYKRVFAVLVQYHSVMYGLNEQFAQESVQCLIKAAKEGHDTKQWPNTQPYLIVSNRGDRFIPSPFNLYQCCS